jgi:hypothetical protein
MIPRNLDRPPMPVEVRCSSASSFERSTSKIVAGPYTLALLPKPAGAETEGILQFTDTRINTHGHSNPEEEGRIILDVLSVLTGTNWSATAIRIRGIDLYKAQEPSHPMLHAIQGDIDVTEEMMGVLRLDRDGLLQFIRASRAFRLGLGVSTTDLSLTFLLLVTSIECLSSLEGFIPNRELNRDSKSVERYVRFIESFCPDQESFYGRDGREGFIRNLKTVYYVHRSAFVHAGREVSIAATSADQLGIPALMHYVDGREVYTPGFMWFCRVARNSLIGFAKNYLKQEIADRTYLQDVAARRAVLTLPLATGDGSTTDDVGRPE